MEAGRATEEPAVTPTTIDDYVTLLTERQPFTLSNIGGDGEFLTILGWPGTNSDGRKSTPEKQEALARCILEPRSTFHGYNPGTPGSEKQKNAEAWLRIQGVNVPCYHPSYITDEGFGNAKINVRWVHKEIIAGANCQGKLGPFLAALRDRKPIVVGSRHLAPMAKRLNARSVYLLPPQVGWEDLERIERNLRQLFTSEPANAVVTWSLGYLTKVLQWRLIPDYPLLTQIDVGAVFDPYCGLRNRRFYKSDKWPAAMEANMKGMERINAA